MMVKKKELKWVMMRGGKVSNTFENRREAVRYFKKILSQTLKDFEKQDKSDEFDYSFTIPEIKVMPVEEREAFLSLI